MSEEDKDTPCNWCGQSTIAAKYPMAIGQEFNLQGGYFSTPGNGFGALDDCTDYKFCLCEYCLDHLMSLFRIPPTIMKYDGEEHSLDHPFESAVERVKKDDWRKGKGEFFAEQNRRAILRPIIK